MSGRDTPRKNGDFLEVPVAADTVVHEGSLVVVDQGVAKPGMEGAALVAAGRAESYVNNAGGAAGAAVVRVRRGVFLFGNDTTDPVTAADLLQDCYVVDAGTVSQEGTGRSVAGKVLGFEAGGVWVEIR